MSFGINGPDNNMPSIQKSHHTNDGGAGNLGYFQRERKKKQEDDDQIDVFEASSKEEEKDDPVLENLDMIGSRIRAFFGMHKKEEKKPEDE